MVRRVTPSQYNAMVRRYNQEVDRVNRANKQAVANYNSALRRHNEAVNREIRKYNQNAQQAVAKYNQAVRTHNSQVRTDRSRLQQQITALKNRPAATTRYTAVQASTYDLHERFERVSREAVYSDAHAELIALSEQESGNSITVAETLLDEAPVEATAGISEDSGILDYLSGFSQDLCDRWQGAVFALNPANPDAARHFCTSAREIFNEILETWAEDGDVTAADANCQRTPQGKPSRRAKIRYLLDRKSISSPELIGFVDADIDNIIQLFNVFNEATHGAAGKHGFTKLKAIRQRVEGGIMFLAAVAT